MDEQATAEGFRGYGPEQGYRFLREAIAQGDFASRGVEIDPDDIFVSDGAKCDLGNFQELFGRGNVIAVTDPVYPVYVDSNVMGGRARNHLMEMGAGRASSICPARLKTVLFRPCL